MSCQTEGVKSTVSACSLGLALGVLKGLCVMLLAWAAWLFGVGGPMVMHMASYYHGVSASFVGGLIGAAYGLVGGFVFGYIFGKLYNFFLCRCHHKNTEIIED
jgi:hypothetical protein